MGKIPESVGKYKILERLGRGGMSVVYKAVHPTLGTPVVLKKLTLKGDAAHRDRFRREASLMMSLRHENVVGVFDHFKEGAGHYLVMEFIDGKPLSELMAREGALPSKEASWLAGEIAEALAHIHSKGIVHRDVKPANVLLGRDGSVKLTDFGIAFRPAGDEEITRSGASLGTPSFMAPEQLEDSRKADKRSDIWSFGVCYFEMLTGRKFVSGAGPAGIREAIPKALRTWSRRLPGETPVSCRRILSRCFRLPPEGRFRDAGALPRRLRRISGRAVPEDLESKIGSFLGTSFAVRFEKDSQATPSVGKTSQSPGLRFPWIRKLNRRRLFGVLPLLALGLIVLWPGAWNTLFRRSSYGALQLSLEYPQDGSASWLEGAEAFLYRQGLQGLEEVRRLSFHQKRRDSGHASSRILSLPGGFYRIRWSLGDTVSWESFHLPPRAAGDFAQPTVRSSSLGDPPQFPLDFRWRAVDALSGDDLSQEAILAINQGTLGAGELLSGGEYQFVVSAPNYRSEFVAVAVNPWRRQLVLEAALWPMPVRLVLENGTSKAIAPRIDGSGRYLDMTEEAGYRRFGRLGPGESRSYWVPPGAGVLTPDFSGKAALDLIIRGGRDVQLRVVEEDDGHLAWERVATP